MSSGYLENTALILNLGREVRGPLTQLSFDQGKKHVTSECQCSCLRLQAGSGAQGLWQQGSQDAVFCGFHFTSHPCFSLLVESTKGEICKKINITSQNYPRKDKLVVWERERRLVVEEQSILSPESLPV